MTLDEFKMAIQVLQEPAASEVRAKYILQFINTQHEFYINVISKPKQFSDGICYEGYLWDCLRQPFTIITFADFIRDLVGHDQVFAFWDVHSRDRILVPDYWHFPKSAALSGPAKIIAENLNYLPEDTYICDNSFSWTLIATHEMDYKRNERVYVRAGETG
jgi:hypothetical protein